MSHAKFTTETRAQIVEAVREGHYLTTAAALAGVARQTIYRWKDRGERAKRGAYREFYLALERADAEAQKATLESIRDGTSEADRWFAARRWPNLYGRAERKEITGAGGGPIRIELHWPSATQAPP